MFLSKTIHASIIGASGYTGVELIRLLLNHPNIKLVSLVADSNANKDISQIYSHLSHKSLPRMTSFDNTDFSSCDVVFCCLPHTASQTIIKQLPKHLKVIDLSADFRLKDPALYEQWYEHPHQATELQQKAVYGLSEIYSKAIVKAQLVACPGCYPTSVLLPLSPLCEQKLIDVNHIVIDSKSGVTGAGRTAKIPNLFCEVNDNFKAYGVCNHRHIPEIEQTLSDRANAPVTINFTPHLLPINRGILSTIYLHLAKGVILDDVRNCLTRFYQDAAFVNILDAGQLPTIRDVAGTNQCHIGLVPGRSANTIVLVSTIDNLIKGASGQAVQNMNLMFGLKETTGLEYIPVFP